MAPLWAGAGHIKLPKTQKTEKRSAKSRMFFVQLITERKSIKTNSFSTTINKWECATQTAAALHSPSPSPSPLNVEPRKPPSTPLPLAAPRLQCQLLAPPVVVSFLGVFYARLAPIICFSAPNILLLYTRDPI